MDTVKFSETTLQRRIVVLAEAEMAPGFQNDDLTDRQQGPPVQHTVTWLMPR